MNVIARASARLRDLWSQDRPAFGVWSTLADPAVLELLAASPFDYVCLDLQHGFATDADLPRLSTALRAAGTAPLVRTAWRDGPTLMRALDSGAAGLVVPMVDDASQAAAAVAACRFPPAGERSWGPMWGYVRPDGALPPGEQDAQVLCLTMVETRAAVDGLEEILRTPGLDGIYIGPNDLALACGFGRGTYRDTPELDRLLERIVEAGRAAGLPVGLHCTDPEMARHWAGRGARMLTVAHDTALLRDAAARAWTAVQD